MPFPRRLSRHGWDFVVAAAATAAAVWVPLVYLADLPPQPYRVEAEVLMTLVFGVDAVRRFWRLRGHLRSVGRTVWVDVLAAIPFGLVFPGSPLALLRLLKLGRVIEVMRLLNRTIPTHAAALRLGYIAYGFALVLHTLACGWIALGGIVPGTPLPFIDALYWTVTTMTTVGYGDITPRTPGQKVYAMGVMLLGVGFYITFVGTIASLLTNLDPARATYLRQKERVAAFMRYRALPDALQERIQQYYDFLWRKRLLHDDEGALLASLSPTLREEVALHLRRDLLEQVPLFRHASDAFIRQIAVHMRAHLYMPGDFILRHGERGHEMFFLVHGLVEVLGAQGQPLSTLTDGDFFGEGALLTEAPRSASIRARTVCNVYLLDRNTFRRVVADFPEVTAHLEEVAARRKGQRTPTTTPPDPAGA